MHLRYASILAFTFALSVACSTEKTFVPPEEDGGAGGSGGSAGESSGGSGGSSTNSAGGSMASGGSTSDSNTTTTDSGTTSSGGTGGSGGGTSTGGTTSSGGSGGSTTSGGGEAGSPPVSECGDGNVDDGEDCDDANQVDADGCQADCTPSFVIDGPLEQVDPAGLDLTAGVTEDNNTVLFFPEAIGVELGGAIPIDLHVPGLHTTFAAQPGVIPAGAVVNSYFLHYDIIGTTPATTQTITITFPDEVMAIVASLDSLNGSGTELGVAGVTYGDGTLNDGSDSVEILADRHTVKIVTTVTIGADHLRIITRAPGDPNSLVYSGALSALQTPPNSTMIVGDLESASAILFSERRGVTLAADLTVDMSEPNTYTNVTFPGALIPLGSQVDSHFVHFDPPGVADLIVAASVTFPSDIVGLAGTDATLDGSDILGSSTPTYPTGNGGRTLDPSDVVTIHADQRSLTFRLEANTGIDQLRAITEAP